MERVTEKGSFGVSNPLLSRGECLVEHVASKDLIDEVKRQWRSLWRERVDDKLRAEGIANVDYSMLFVERGTVIFATRNFRMPSFREILELHGIGDVERVVPPNPQIGGWGKFIRTMISKKGSTRRAKMAAFYLEEGKQKQQLKKSGRGWLHL